MKHLTPKNFIKFLSVFFLLAAVITSCSKSDDGNNEGGEPEISAGIKIVYTMLSPVEGWTFTSYSIMDVGNDLENAEIVYENLEQSGALALLIDPLEEDATIHTISTSPNALSIVNNIFGTRPEGNEEVFNYTLEIFHNNVLKHTASYTDSVFSLGSGFKYDLEEGFEEL